MIPLEELSDGIYFVDHSSKNVVNSNGMAMANILHIDKNLNTWMVNYVSKKML